MSHWTVGRSRYARALAYLAGRTAAGLALDGGVRRSVGWLETAFRKGLVDEMESQGITRKVMATMFGLPLRTFQRQLASLREAAVGTPGLTLWSTLHRRLQSPCETEAVIEAFPKSAQAEVAAVLRDMEANGWLRRQGTRLQAAAAEAPWEDNALREALWAETILNPGASPVVWARNLSVPVARIQPLLGEILANQADTRSPRRPEAVFSMLAGHLTHQIGLLQRRTGHDVALFQVQIGRLSVEERDALDEDLNALLERAREIYETYYSDAPPEDTHVHRWSVVTARNTIPFQWEL